MKTPLSLSRINDSHKRETLEIAVNGADLGDAMLSHQNGSMQIVNSVTANFGQFGYRLS